MKKILIFIYVAISSVPLIAQNKIKIEPFFSVERSVFPREVNLGNYGYEEATASTISVIKKTTGSSTGFYLSTGAILEYPLNGRLSLRGGISYANRHFKGRRLGECSTCSDEDQIYTNYPRSTTFRLSYIDIPLSARYYLLSKRFTLYTDAGITTSPRVHGETVISAYNAKSGSTHVKDAPTHEVMLMAQFGIGAGMRFETGGFNVSGLYRNGITKFATTDNYRFKSWGVSLSFFRYLN